MLQAVAALLAAATPPCDGCDVLLYSYFRTSSEALHIAYSFDGYNFTALNGNRPVLDGTAPYTSIRDPFVGRSADGSAFHVVATAGGFGVSDRIHHWTLNLTSGKPVFSAGEVPEVMKNVSGTQECWAPEWVYDEASQRYLVFWASQTPQSPDGKRIWGAWTKDFGSFSEPQRLLDPGYTVIDANAHRLSNGTHLLFFKDERDVTSGGSQKYKAVRRATSATPAGPYTEVSGLLSPHMTEGPELVEFGNPSKKKYLLYYDCFSSIGERGVSVSDDLTNFDVVNGCGGCDPSKCGVSFPDGCRHGSFTPITRSELAVLVKQWP
eukprot:TRINITY_DN47281_c0_g1_i1.p1 TRINITY_DN47281_c0_g1~~TRINITY_DN47281_c0_g1_i1.p1  ORF type:complete len:322 (+),score=89.14 TRINITY_DN47281_c0_g1_i1:48-1013(+)